jgi:hypothetical protein
MEANEHKMKQIIKRRNMTNVTRQINNHSTVDFKEKHERMMKILKERSRKPTFKLMLWV